MVDERMASAVTNINTSKRSLQSVRTVRDHVKIRAFHRANDPDVRIMIPGSLSSQVLLKLVLEKAQKIKAYRQMA
jgi:hypothetical protein